jgi:hypothetical protein
VSPWTPAAVARLAWYLVSLVVGGFDFAHGDGSPLLAYLMLTAATVLSGRWMLCVTAPRRPGCP